jgi:non-specific serine/threonine protein kinase/serine/threonine-protein kinase
MALRHEPDRRYPSVEQLSEDIRRHLEGLPVSARPDTLAYRSSKFVRRHKAGVVAASLLALSLVGGAAATLREARIARAQQQRAERRFNDVRTLANSLFDIQDSIEHLPGATPARKLVIDNALRYLDSLAREAEGDSGLERELANGYYRLGRVQGLPAQSNIGDTEGSLASFRKALALRAQVARANPQSIDDQLDLSTAHRAVSGLLAATGKAGAAEERELAVAIDQRLEHQWPNNRSIRRQLGRDYEALGGMEDGYGRWRKATEYFAAEYELSQTDARANPSDRSSLRALGVSAELLGRELGRAGLLDKGLRYINESLRIYQTLAADLNDAQVMRELAFVKESQAEIFAARGEYSRAVTVASEALTITQRLLSADPQNAMLRRDRAGSYLAVGRDLGAMGKTRRALAMLNQSVQLLEREVRSSPADEDLPYILSLSYLARADLLYGGRKLRDALADYRRAESELKKQVALPDNAGTAADLADVSVRLASSFARVGQLVQAEAEYRRALDLAKPLFEQDNLSAGPPLAESYAGLAKLHERQGASQEACSLCQKSAAVWQRTPNPSLTDVSGLLTGNAATRRKLAACRAKAKRAVAGS